MFLGFRAGHAAVMVAGDIACQRASQEEFTDSAAVFDAIISQAVMIMTLKQMASGSIGGRWVGLQSIRPDAAAEQRLNKVSDCPELVPTASRRG